MSFRDGPLVCVVGGPLPAPPELLPKTVYEPLTPALYLSLWDALQVLGEVSAASRGARPGRPPNSCPAGRENQLLITSRPSLQL